MSEMERLLNDIRAYLRISAAAASRPIAKSTLDTYEKALVYSKLDGKMPQTKIEVETKVAQQTISNWLAGFIQACLASPPDKYNPSHRALFTLQELGIELGMLKKRSKTTRPTSQPSPISTTLAPSEPQEGTFQATLEPEKGGAPTQ